MFNVKIIIAAVIFLLINVLQPCQSNLDTSRMTSRNVDLTLIPGNIGKNVVEACISKINSRFSNYSFPQDYGLLFRLALVETNFGTNLSNPLDSGGIWAISNKISTAVLNNRKTRLVLIGAANELGIVEKKSYRIPLRSAYFARLFIVLTEEMPQNEPIPVTLKQQANWWSKFYSPGSSPSHFIRIVEAYEAREACSISKADVMFALDGSRNVNSDEFRNSLNLVMQISRNYTIANDSIHTGFVVYSAAPKIISRFNEHTNKNLFIIAVNSTQSTDGDPGDGKNFNISDALTGARSNSQGIPRILVLVAVDSAENFLIPIQQFKDEGFVVVALRISRSFSSRFSKQLVIDSSYDFSVARLQNLTKVLQNRVSTLICNSPTVLMNNTKTAFATSTTSGNKRFLFHLPRGSIALVRYVINSGAGTTYLSTFYNPNSALHNFAYPISSGETTIEFGSYLGSGILNMTGTGFQHRSKRQVEILDDINNVFISIEASVSIITGFITVTINGSSNFTEPTTPKQTSTVATEQENAILEITSTSVKTLSTNTTSFALNATTSSTEISNGIEVKPTNAMSTEPVTKTNSTIWSDSANKLFLIGNNVTTQSPEKIYIRPIAELYYNLVKLNVENGSILNTLSRFLILSAALANLYHQI